MHWPHRLVIAGGRLQRSVCFSSDFVRERARRAEDLGKPGAPEITLPS